MAHVLSTYINLISQHRDFRDDVVFLAGEWRALDSGERDLVKQAAFVRCSDVWVRTERGSRLQVYAFPGYRLFGRKHRIRVVRRFVREQMHLDSVAEYMDAQIDFGEFSLEHERYRISQNRPVLERVVRALRLTPEELALGFDNTVHTESAMCEPPMGNPPMAYLEYLHVAYTAPHLLGAKKSSFNGEV